MDSRIQIRMAAASLAKCCGFGFDLVGVSHFAKCLENRPLTV